MSIHVPFSGVARNFLDELSKTRRSLHAASTRLQADARHARSWGFYAIGGIAAKLLHREGDQQDRHEHDVRSVAERAVWLTHFMNDPTEIAKVKEQIVADNGGTVSRDELDDYLTEHLDELPLHGASPKQRETMKANMRRKNDAIAPMPVVEL